MKYRKTAAGIMAVSLLAILTLPSMAQYNNTAANPLGSVLPGVGQTVGVDLAKELRNGTVLPVANGGTGASGSAYTNGQVAIGSTATGTASPHTITGTANQVVVTNGAGTITLSTPQSINTTSSPTFAALTLSSPLTVPNGGTGAATFTAHGVLLGEATGAVTPTAALTNGQLLIGSTGADPAPATLTAGTGISVTNGAGSVTLATNPVTGTVALSSGASGTISSATVTTSSIIMVSYKGASLTNSGQLAVNPGTGSFTISSTNGSDGNTVMWYLVKP